MSKISTLNITRVDAIVLILRELLSTNDDVICTLAHKLWGNGRHYNFKIVDKYDETSFYNWRDKE